MYGIGLLVTGPHCDNNWAGRFAGQSYSFDCLPTSRSRFVQQTRWKVFYMFNDSTTEEQDCMILFTYNLRRIGSTVRCRKQSWQFFLKATVWQEIQDYNCTLLTGSKTASATPAAVGQGHTIPVSTPASREKKNFFASIATRRQERVGNGIRPDANIEVDKYLADLHVLSMTSNINIWKNFIKLNTGLLSNAAVEKLFSLGG